MAPQRLTLNDVRRLLDAGADHSDIAEYLVNSGIWSTNGANEIIRFLTRGPDELLARHWTPPAAHLEKRARHTLSA
jgi:hypothetical protein